MRTLLIIFLFSSITSLAQQSIDLSSYHTCWAKLVEGDNSISFLTPSKEECSNGSAVLAYSTFLGRRAGKAIYEISDTVNVRSNCPENCLYITRCENKEGDKEYLILIQEDYSKEYFDNVNAAWTYSTNSKKLKKVDPSSIKCLNMDFGVD
jgi:hypothetical protein